jgi:NDP-sugar pyrophosphorylase family protein
VAYRHDGFWACMDTFKDKQRLDDMNAQGDCPWEVWKREPGPHDVHVDKSRNGATAAETPGRRPALRGPAGQGRR